MRAWEKRNKSDAALAEWEDVTAVTAEVKKETQTCAVENLITILMK